MKTLKSSSLNHSMFHIPYSFDILQDNLNTHKKKKSWPAARPVQVPPEQDDWEIYILGTTKIEISRI